MTLYEHRNTSLLESVDRTVNKDIYSFVEQFYVPLSNYLEPVSL